MISLIIPPRDQISRVSKMLSDECARGVEAGARGQTVSVRSPPAVGGKLTEYGQPGSTNVLKSAPHDGKKPAFRLSKGFAILTSRAYVDAP